MKHTLQRAQRLGRRVPSLVALAAGVLAALAHPPFGFLPGLLGYGLLMALGEIAPTRNKAFQFGWTAGLGYFAVGCWWVAEAFMVDAEVFGWMAPIAVTLLAGGLAIFWGLALFLYRAVAPRGVARLFVFAGALCLFEWLRGHLFTGFPWNLPGETWRAGGAVSQFAAVIGAYGLTWVTLVIAASPALLWRPESRKAARAVVGGAAALLAVLVAYGVYTLSQPVEATATLVRVVQPDIPQAAKYDEAAYDAIVARYVALTAQPSALGVPRVIVWPEGAIPDSANNFLAPQSPTLQAIMGALRPGQILLVGAYRFDGPGAEAKVYNTLIALQRTQDDLRVLGVYDKHRLVPFGEYLPLERYLAPLGVKKLVPLDSFSSGPAPRPMKIGDIIAQPLICYESLFPGFTRAGARMAGRRADVIVNISNDAWFGATTGPRQHLNLASYRAIEEGLPMIRGTPTGISAVIDPHGRTAKLLPLGKQGVVDAFLARASPPTPYARGGELGFLTMLTISGLILTRVLVSRRKTA